MGVEIGIDAYRQLSREKKLVLFTLVSAPHAFKRRCLTTMLGNRLGVGRMKIGAAGDALVERRVLGTWKGYGNEGGFCLCARFPIAVLREMVHEADAQKWWPTDAELKTYWERGYAYGWEKEGLHVVRVTQHVLRSLILGTDSDLTPQDKRGIQLSKGVVLRMAACQLWSLTTEQPLLTGEFGVAFKGGLLQCWLNLCFVAGYDVRPMLAEISRRLDGGFKPTKAFVRVYASLCVWTGFKEGLDHRQLNDEEAFGYACQLALAGKFVEANKLFRNIWDARKSDETDADNLPARVLLLTVCMAVKPAKTRPVQLMRGHGCDLPYEWDRFGTAQRYYKTVARVNRAWVDSWPYVVDGRGVLIRQGNLASDSPVTAHLLMAWDWHFLSSGRASYHAKVAELFVITRQFAAVGYVNVAGLMLSLMTGAYEPESVRDLISEVDAHGVWFLPRIEPEPEWKNLIGILEKFLDKREKKETRESRTQLQGSIVWNVEFEGPYEGDACLDIDRVFPALRPLGGPTDGSEDKKLDFRDLDKKKFRACMSEADVLFYKTLLASDDDDYFMSRDMSQEKLDLLCDLPNVVRPVYDEKEDRYYSEQVGATPIRIVKRPCQLSVTTQEDGGLAIQVPAWLSSCRNDYAIRRLGDCEYAYIPIGRDVRQLASTFEEFGVGGKVVFPGAAMASAGPVLERLTQVMPVAEPAADAVDALKRIPAESALTVRLDFSEGVLTVRAVVLPVRGNVQMTLDPGSGPAEKVVAGALDSYVLVRDLAAEAAGLGRVRSALTEAESWFDGRSAWTIDDIGVALAALAALKALDPPVALEWIQDRRLNVAYAPTSGVTLESFRTADEWFSVKGAFKLDDGRVLSVVQLLEAMRGRRGAYVRLSDGDYLSLTKSMARELDALASVGRRKGDGIEVSRAAIPMLDGVFGEEKDALPLPEALAKSAAEIRALFAKRPEIPSTLTAELRPYQEDGFRWLSRLAACGLGSCLADDMGLGKTLQVIALLLERAADGTSLVVAPSSVCGNWRREIRRFAPTLNPVLAMETPDAAFAGAKRTVTIVSYGYLLFHEADYAAHGWNGVVLDEAQAIKNDASKRARAVKRLKAKFRVAATGTPVENRLGELWSLFDFLNPGLLGTATSFASRFTQDGRATPGLKRTVKPLVLRRLKGDVLEDLPEKTEITIPVVLGETERSAYEGCRLHALASLAQGDGEQNRISILAELTRLRRFCCHPSLVLGEGDVPSAKMEALVDLLEGLKAGGHRALVFSQFVDYLSIVRRVLEAHGWSYRYLDGATPTLERERLVEEFQSGDGDFFLISLKAGGTGLNLTAANYVILLDPWWNPAVENQAADRTHRIGQTQPVTVYRLVAEDTVEERVIELHQQKTAMSADLLDGTSDAKFSPEDLMKLFQAKERDK